MFLLLLCVAFHVSFYIIASRQTHTRYVTAIVSYAIVWGNKKVPSVGDEYYSSCLWLW